MEGWLYKESKRSGDWKRRYFVLRDKQLFYYGDDECAMLCGEFLLKDAIAWKEPDDQPGHRGRLGNKFTVSSPNRVLELAGETCEVASGWVEAIDKAVERNETQLAAEQIFDEQEIKVYLPDSTFYVLRIDAETTAADVAHATAEKVGLANLLDHFALIELSGM